MRNIDIDGENQAVHLRMDSLPENILMQMHSGASLLLREAPQKKKRENVGILKKQGGGGLPESHFHVLLFLTWENPPKRS